MKEEIGLLVTFGRCVGSLISSVRLLEEPQKHQSLEL